EGEVLLGIRHIQIRQILPPAFRHPTDYAIRKITMRIEECQTGTIDEVLPDHHFEKTRLAGSRLSNDVHVRGSVLLRDPENPSLSAPVGPAEVCEPPLSAMFLRGVTRRACSSRGE
ncbi:MAG TPA: hypothetical protein VEZ11_06135, partial [Thermoanaerobaculia bacterium]|nr:hypothetical protein [Thermoanaerobaculia bacterium]